MSLRDETAEAWQSQVMATGQTLVGSDPPIPILVLFPIYPAAQPMLRSNSVPPGSFKFYLNGWKT